MLFLALMSVGLWAYTRTLLTSAAADAARMAANYDAADAVATAQVAELLGDGMTGSTRSTLACSSGGDGAVGDRQLHHGVAGDHRAARRRDADHRGHWAFGQGDARMRRLLAMPSGPRCCRSAGRPETDDQDAGRAMIEVVFLAVLILIPTVYILASVMRIQAATFAVVQGARDAGRVIDSAPSLAEGVARAEEIAQLALADQRVPSDGHGPAVRLRRQRLCVEPGDRAQPATRRCLRRLRGGCRDVSGCARR